ncbi:hypothetical protein [Levilactobacillus andaensis]|uniref:hypothetical protein n=1 Tax=Levilactobacillus andaensis TaxID=2799570 RepID=UPI0019452C76|nr:hypothetical protein [Levilactobacillus andaensis]
MTEKFATKQEDCVAQQDISDQINLQSARMDTKFAQLSQQATENEVKIEKLEIPLSRGCLACHLR